MNKKLSYKGHDSKIFQRDFFIIQIESLWTIVQQKSLTTSILSLHFFSVVFSGEFLEASPLSDWADAQSREEFISSWSCCVGLGSWLVYVVNTGLDIWENGQAPSWNPVVLSLPKRESLWMSIWGQINGSCGQSSFHSVFATMPVSDQVRRSLLEQEYELSKNHFTIFLFWNVWWFPFLPNRPLARSMRSSHPEV